MTRRVWPLVLAAGIVISACGGTGAGSAASSSQNKSPLKVAVVVGVTGSQAPSSEMWIAGIKQATKEINAQGGILGHPVQTFTLDTRSDPATSIASMRDALQQQPYVVLGTILSSATLVNMNVLAQAGVPQFSGSVSPAITAKHPTDLLDTEPNSDLEAQMFANWVVNQAHAKKVDVIHSDDEFGVSGAQSFSKLLASTKAKVASDISTTVGQTGFSGQIAKIQQDNPDTVFMYMHETETGRFLQQAQNAGLQNKIRFIGASSALAQSTVQLAGNAADGVQGFVPYSASAPTMKKLATAYEDSHGGAAPDHNYYKGYVALWTVAYGTKAIGKLDQKALIKYLHNRAFCVNKYPHMLESTYWDSSGNIDRTTFVVKIDNGQQVVTSSIPPLHPSHFKSC